MDVDSATTTDADADAEGDADADAEGETDATPSGTTGTVTPALQPPTMIVEPPSAANSDSGGASPKAVAATLLGSAAAQVAGAEATAPLASTSALPYGSTPTPSPGLSAPSTTPQPPPATISPSLLAGVSPTSPVPSSSIIPPTAPYTSLFGIPEISSTYASSLPELPAEVLRNRLNSSVRKKGKEKANQLPPPDLYKMHSKAVHTGAKNFLGRGKRVHNVLSTHDWSVSWSMTLEVELGDLTNTELTSPSRWSGRAGGSEGDSSVRED